MNGEGVECLHVPFETRFLAGGQIQIVHAELSSLGEQRIIDVGHVAHAPDLVTQVDEPALQHVVRQESRRVTDVGGVVRRDSAGVHRHPVARLERNNLTSRGVVEAHAHPASVP